MSQGLPIVGLAFVDGQLWLARENGSVEGPGGLSIQLDPDPTGLVCEQTQLWVWGRKRTTLWAQLRINGPTAQDQNAPLDPLVFDLLGLSFPNCPSRPGWSSSQGRVPSITCPGNRWWACRGLEPYTG